MRNIPAMVLVLGLLTVLGPEIVSARSVTSNFKGTLASAVNGNNSVTGQFTLDTTLPDPNTRAPGSIVSFSFSTGIGTIDPALYTPFLFTFTPAAVPNTDFVVLEFIQSSPCCNFLQLIFQTNLSSFSVSTFFAGNVNTGSAFGTLLSQLNDGVRTTFTSASATPGTPAEASMLVLLAIGLLSLLLLQHRFRQSRLVRRAGKSQPRLDGIA